MFIDQRKYKNFNDHFTILKQRPYLIDNVECAEIKRIPYKPALRESTDNFFY